MVSVFLSPSDQLGNTYAVGDTNEAVVCQQICNKVEDILASRGVMVDSDPNMYNAVDRSNKMRPDLHLAIHTNASVGHNVRGVRVFYYPGSEYGKTYAEKFFRSLSALYEGSHAVKTNAVLYELRKTVSPAVYLELDFHDNPDGAKWLIGNKEVIANTICNTIFSIFGLSQVAFGDDPLLEAGNSQKNYTFCCPHCGQKLEVTK